MKFAHTMAWVTKFCAAALPLSVIVIWMFWDVLGPKAAALSGYALDPASIGALPRLGAAALMLLGAGLQSYGLLCLAKTFEQAASGQALSDTAIAGFQRFSWIVLAMVPLGVAIRAGVIAIVSGHDSIPGGFLPITFGSGELRTFFIGLLLVFVAQVFRQGQAAEIENKSFI